MGTEDDRGAIGNLVQFLDENRPPGTQIVHDVPVMDHFVAYVDGGTVEFQGALDDLDGAIHAGTETARIGKQDIHGQAPEN